MADIAFIFDGRKKNMNLIFQDIEKCLGPAHHLKKFSTEYAGHAIQLAEQAVKEGFDHIICVGGDGSLNEVTNGLMKAKKGMSEDSWNNIRLGALPMGSGNDFVKTVKAPDEIAGLKKVIEADNYKIIDLGLVDFYSKSGEEQSRYFINITDVGMGGVVVEKLSRYSKQTGALLNYQRAILTTFLSYKKQPVKAKADSFRYEGNIMNFVVANGKYFGNGLGIAPDAEIDDGMFSVVVLGDISLLDYLKNLGKVRKCLKIEHPGLIYKTATEVQMESLSGKLPIDMDGEFIGFSPMKVRMVPATLRFLCD
jgi:diacylglycerol kinase (ATP)